MATETDIGNLALGRIKQPGIAGFDEASAQAPEVSRLYPLVRDFVQADFPWRVTTTLTTLTTLTNDRPNDFLYKYQRPTCLRFRHILDQYGRYNPRQPVLYEMTAAGIYCDIQNARAVISVRVTDTSLFSPALMSCIAWKLAHELAPILDGSDATENKALRNYMLEKRGAQATDLSEYLKLNTEVHGESEVVRAMMGC